MAACPATTLHPLRVGRLVAMAGNAGVAGGGGPKVHLRAARHLQVVLDVLARGRSMGREGDMVKALN
eukprot:9976071-Alexandrium_andersonii.AAC.1